EPADLGAESREHALDSWTRAELRMKRLVVLAVSADELVDARGVERAHLLEEARTADRGKDPLVRHLAPEHGPGGVLERGEDHPARVDQGAVEVEEDDWKPHRAMVSSPSATADSRPHGDGARA